MAVCLGIELSMRRWWLCLAEFNPDETGHIYRWDVLDVSEVASARGDILSYISVSDVQRCVSHVVAHWCPVELRAIQLSYVPLPRAGGRITLILHAMHDKVLSALTHALKDRPVHIGKRFHHHMLPNVALQTGAALTTPASPSSYAERRGCTEQHIAACLHGVPHWHEWFRHIPRRTQCDFADAFCLALCAARELAKPEAALLRRILRVRRNAWKHRVAAVTMWFVAWDARR